MESENFYRRSRAHLVELLNWARAIWQKLHLVIEIAEKEDFKWDKTRGMRHMSKSA
jgi:hypothetical protein